MPYTVHRRVKCCRRPCQDTGHARQTCVQCGTRYDSYGRKVGLQLKGVDIDAIHYKLGAVKMKVAA